MTYDSSTFLSRMDLHACISTVVSRASDLRRAMIVLRDREDDGPLSSLEEMDIESAIDDLQRVLRIQRRERQASAPIPDGAPLEEAAE